jgi:hypothetical protein
VDISTPLMANAVTKEEIDLNGNIYAPHQSSNRSKTLVPSIIVDAPPKEVLDQNGNVYGLVSSSVDPWMNGNKNAEENKEPLNWKLEEEEEKSDEGAKRRKTGTE